MECGMRPSRIKTFLTPQSSASMQLSTLGIMPPFMMPRRKSSTASFMSATGIRLAGSAGSSMMPAISVMEMRHSAPMAPEMCAAMVSALML